jgi:hypothetical protein
MNRIRQSFDGLKSMVTNVISFVAGQNELDPSNNNDSSISSGEIVECDSDCSECCSHPGSKSSSSLRQGACSSRQSKMGEQRLDLLARSLNENFLQSSS